MRRKTTPPERERIAILQRLIASRHFNGLWLRGTYLYARMELCEDPYLLQWAEARRIAGLDLDKKPARRATGARRTLLARRRA